MKQSFCSLCVLVASLLAIAACGASGADSPPDACAQGVACNGSCINVSADEANCGACGHACAAGEACIAGACAPSCAPSQTACANAGSPACTDLRSDPASCGACGHACGDGEVCASGACAGSCAAPLATCDDGTCVDPRLDPANCGACGAACAAGEVCSAGACIVPCNAPLVTCGAGAGGACVDLRNDPHHCGACDVACPGDQVCNAGACGPSCAAPFTVCGTGDAARCLDLRSDPAHCGACDVACAAGEACLSGVCTATCEDAGGTVCDGTCVDTGSDNTNCGTCGNACPAGTACVAAECKITCAPGQHACDGTCRADDDPQSCGTCGNVCASGICRDGACAAPVCEGTIGLPGRPLPPQGTAVDQPFAHALLDLDGDGRLDLAIPRANEGVVELRLVQGPGTFGPAVNIQVAGKPQGLAIGDVDGDGRLDLVSCSRDPSGAISVLFNRGNTAFERVDLPGAAPAFACALGDLDGDGRPDLVLSYNRSSQIGVAHNTGGSFAPATLYASGKPLPRDVALADLDRDGKLDVVVLNVPTSTNASDPEVDRGSVSVYRGAGDGTLGAPVSYATGDLALDFEVGDLDGDGWLDVATAAFDGEGVAVLRNDGQGGLLPRVVTAIADRMATVTAGDLDNDGDLDLVAGSFGNIWVFHNEGNASFSVEGPFAISNAELALADATGDGVLDLLVGTTSSQIVPQEAGHLVAPVSVAAGGERVELADFDGDGRLDAVTGSGGVLLLRGLADGGFAPPALLASSPQSKFESAAGDVDGDGHPDLVYGGGSAFLTVRHNLGDGSFGPAVVLPTGSLDFNAAPTLGDLDGDGDLDLAVAIGFQFPGALQVYWNDGHGNFTLGPRMTTGGDSRTPVIGHLTAVTGRPDILVPNWSDGTISVFQGHADDTFSLFATLAAPQFAKTAVVRDVTQDGRADLITVGPGPLFGTDFRVRIYPGTEHGLGAPIDFPAGTFPTTVAVTDVDADGRPDIIVGGSRVVIHRALPGGGFAAPVVYGSPLSDGLAVGDLNGDLRPDLVTVAFGGPLTAELNRCLTP